MRSEESEIVMNDGTRYYCHGGVIGFDLEDDKYKLTYGCAGSFNEEFMTKAHKREIAEHMARVWSLYAKLLEDAT